LRHENSKKPRRCGGTRGFRSRQGQIASENSPSPDSPQADPRLVFLARASARELLVDAGELTIDEAFEGLVPAFLEILEGVA